MAETVSNQNIVITMKSCLKDFQSTYNRHYSEDLKERKQALKPGEPAPLEDGIIYNPKRRTLCQEEMQQIRARANDLLDKAIAETRDEMMEAPSQEAINALTALGIVGEKLTADDLLNAYEKYGQNYLCCRALNGLADKSGNQGHKKGHELATTLDGLADLKKTVADMELLHAEKGFADPGRVSFVVNDLEAKWGHFDDGESGATE